MVSIILSSWKIKIRQKIRDRKGGGTRKGKKGGV